MSFQKHCYICKNHGWSDANWKLDYYQIEILNELLESSTFALSNIIEIINAYKSYCNSTITTLNAYHSENCFRCPTCFQHVEPYLRRNMPLREDDADIDYEKALCHFAGLSENQYDVLEKLKNCGTEIIAINDMIGMSNIKSEFAKVIKYLSTYEQEDNEPLMHMGIYGPPGHGKTQIARLIGKAFAKSGLLSKPDVFVLATRADLIGAYCGHTAKNTTKMFDLARGGVIFIDEIYALGNPKKEDVFTKECIDTINQLLSERTDTLCIIAGYEDDADKSFFSYNKGLARRFPFNFVIKPYTAEELCLIFAKLARDSGWKLEENAIRPADLDLKILDNAGGDMENILIKTIMSHYENSFLSSEIQMKYLVRNDVIAGIESYKKHKKTKDSESAPPPYGMYL